MQIKASLFDNLQEEQIKALPDTSIVNFTETVYLIYHNSSWNDAIIMQIKYDKYYTQPTPVQAIYDGIYKFKIAQNKHVDSLKCKISIRAGEHSQEIDVTLQSPIGLQITQLACNKQKSFLQFQITSLQRIKVKQLIIQTNNFVLKNKYLVNQIIDDGSIFHFYQELSELFYQNWVLQLLTKQKKSLFNDQNQMILQAQQIKTSGKKSEKYLKELLQLQQQQQQILLDYKCLLSSLGIYQKDEQVHQLYGIFEDQSGASSNLFITLLYESCVGDTGKTLQGQSQQTLQFQLDLKPHFMQQLKEVLNFLQPSPHQFCPVAIDFQLVDSIPQEHNQLNQSSGYYCIQLIIRNVKYQPIKNVIINFLDTKTDAGSICIAVTKQIFVKNIEPNQHETAYVELYSYAHKPILCFNEIVADGISYQLFFNEAF